MERRGFIKFCAASVAALGSSEVAADARVRLYAKAKLVIDTRNATGDIRSTDFLRLTALRGGNGQPRAAQFSVRVGF